MGCTTLDLREKSVINVCNGQKLGCVAELEIDTDCGKVTALIVSPESFVSLIFSKNQIRVPWDKIQKIGKDAILVDLPMISQKKCDDCENDMKCKKDEEDCEKGCKGKWWRF